ncbi:hypothetical protein HMPREF3218_0201374 [Prevotella bivia]|nr:hypothetical protein HMPREF3218_0201374 [Prevotella bivia]
MERFVQIRLCLTHINTIIIVEYILEKALKHILFSVWKKL